MGIDKTDGHGAGTSGPPITVRFDGQSLEAFAGEPLFAALLRAGIFSVGKAPVTGRPRGYRWNDRPGEISVMVGEQIRISPLDLRLQDGMDISSSDGPPEAIDHDPARDCSETHDTRALVVGGGLAGLMAARTFATAGVETILAEQSDHLGGSPCWHGDRNIKAWVEETCADLEANDNISIRKGARLIGVDGARYFFQDLDRVQNDPAQPVSAISATQTILATGAHDRMIAFENNDLPGIMTVAAMRQAVTHWGALAGRSVAIFANNDDAYGLVPVIHARGGHVVAIVDPRQNGPRIARDPELLTFSGAAVVSATVGPDGAVREITLVQGRKKTSISVDAVAVSGGWTPAIGAVTGSGIKPIWNPMIHAWLLPPGQSDALQSAGAAGGSFTARAALKSGYFRARRALGALGVEVVSMTVPEAPDEDPRTADYWQVPKGKAAVGPRFLDFTHDHDLDSQLDGGSGARADEIARRYLSSPRVS